MNDLNANTFFNGRLHVAQPDSGYRYSIDAVLLASLPRPKSGDSVIDLGTGCGIIAMILAYRHPGVRFYAVEIQSELVRFARENVRSNHMADRISVIQTDMRHLSADQVGGTANWIVSNPPYRRANSGRINPDTQKALARHEINLDLSQLVKTSGRLLRAGGRFCTIYPAERTIDLVLAMRDGGIEPKWMQCIHSRWPEQGKLVLVEGVNRGNPGLTVAAPLVVYDAGGNYTKDVQRLMAPN